MTVKERKQVKNWAYLPPTGLVLITGFRGEGKSALAWYLAEEHQRGEGQVAAFDFTPQARKLLPSWVKHVNDVRGVSRLQPSLLIVDEGALKVHARRHQSSDNIEWTQLLAVARHKQHLVILITQHNRQVDVGLVADADWVIMKRPSELHLRFARPELRPELDEAFQGFKNERNHRLHPQEWSYVVDYHLGYRGWLKNPLPTFWSDSLSRSFAAVELAAAEIKVKVKKQRATRGAEKAHR